MEHCLYFLIDMLIDNALNTTEHIQFLLQQSAVLSLDFVLAVQAYYLILPTKQKRWRRPEGKTAQVRPTAVAIEGRGGIAHVNAG